MVKFKLKKFKLKAHFLIWRKILVKKGKNPLSDIDINFVFSFKYICSVNLN